MNTHECDFNCHMLNYLRVNFYHCCCQESAKSFAGRMINLNVNEGSKIMDGPILDSYTNEILHLLSIEETNGERERSQVFPGPAKKLWLSSRWDAGPSPPCVPAFFRMV